MTIAIITFILLLSVHVITCALYVRMDEWGEGGGLYGVDDAFMHFRFENENKSQSYNQERDTNIHMHTFGYMVQALCIP